MAKFGTSNPNYRHGNYCGAYPNNPMDNISLRLQLQAKLREILSADLEHHPPTNQDARWALLVSQEWPEWSHAILREFGFSRVS